MVKQAKRRKGFKGDRQVRGGDTLAGRKGRFKSDRKGRLTANKN